MLKRRVPNLDDKLFKNDLAKFFYNPAEYDNWHHNWKQRFVMLISSYEIYEIKKGDGNDCADLREIHITKDFSNDNRHFHFYYNTAESSKSVVRFSCSLSEYWYIFADFKILSGHRDKYIDDRIKDNGQLSELDYEYAGLFFKKIEDYLKRNAYVVLQPELKTKLIRATADNLNVKTQVFLDRRLLEKERFEDLL